MNNSSQIRTQHEKWLQKELNDCRNNLKINQNYKVIEHLQHVRQKTELKTKIQMLEKEKITLQQQNRELKKEREQMSTTQEKLESQFKAKTKEYNALKLNYISLENINKSEVIQLEECKATLRIERQRNNTSHLTRPRFVVENQGEKKETHIKCINLDDQQVRPPSLSTQLKDTKSVLQQTQKTVLKLWRQNDKLKKWLMDIHAGMYRVLDHKVQALIQKNEREKQEMKLQQQAEEDYIENAEEDQFPGQMDQMNNRKMQIEEEPMQANICNQQNLLKSQKSEANNEENMNQEQIDYVNQLIKKLAPDAKTITVFNQSFGDQVKQLLDYFQENAILACEIVKNSNVFTENQRNDNDQSQLWQFVEHLTDLRSQVINEFQLISGKQNELNRLYSHFDSSESDCREVQKMTIESTHRIMKLTQQLAQKLDKQVENFKKNSVILLKKRNNLKKYIEGQLDSEQIKIQAHLSYYDVMEEQLLQQAEQEVKQEMKDLNRSLQQQLEGREGVMQQVVQDNGKDDKLIEFSKDFLFAKWQEFQKFKASQNKMKEGSQKRSKMAQQQNGPEDLQI